MKPNLNKIDEISNGDDFFKKKIIEIIQKEFPKEKTQYYLSLKEEDYNTTALIVHKLKHKINLLDLKDGFNLAQDFEVDLKNNKLDLKEKFDRLLLTIETFLNTLNL